MTVLPRGYETAMAGRGGRGLLFHQPTAIRRYRLMRNLRDLRAGRSAAKRRPCRCVICRRGGVRTGLKKAGGRANRGGLGGGLRGGRSYSAQSKRGGHTRWDDEVRGRFQ